MSSTTPVGSSKHQAEISPSGTFNQTAALYFQECSDLIEEGQGGSTVELRERAVALEYRVRAAFKQIIDFNIKNVQNGLANLNETRVSLLESGLGFTNERTPAIGLQGLAQDLLQLPSKNVTEVIESDELISGYAQTIYEELVNVLKRECPTDKTAAEYGKSLFEDTEVEASSKAQAMLNVASALDLVTEKELTNIRDIYGTAEKTDEVVSETMENLASSSSSSSSSSTLSISSPTTISLPDTVGIPTNYFFLFSSSLTASSKLAKSDNSPIENEGSTTPKREAEDDENPTIESFDSDELAAENEPPNVSSTEEPDTVVSEKPVVGTTKNLEKLNPTHEIRRITPYLEKLKKETIEIEKAAVKPSAEHETPVVDSTEEPAAVVNQTPVVSMDEGLKQLAAFDSTTLALNASLERQIENLKEEGRELDENLEPFARLPKVTTPNSNIDQPAPVVTEKPVASTEEPATIVNQTLVSASTEEPAVVVTEKPVVSTDEPTPLVMIPVNVFDTMRSDLAEAHRNMTTIQSKHTQATSQLEPSASPATISLAMEALEEAREEMELPDTGKELTRAKKAADRLEFEVQTAEADAALATDRWTQAQKEVHEIEQIIGDLQRKVEEAAEKEAATKNSAEQAVKELRIAASEKEEFLLKKEELQRQPVVDANERLQENAKLTKKLELLNELVKTQTDMTEIHKANAIEARTALFTVSMQLADSRRTLETATAQAKKLEIEATEMEKAARAVKQKADDSAKLVTTLSDPTVPVPTQSSVVNTPVVQKPLTKVQLNVQLQSLLSFFTKQTFWSKQEIDRSIIANQKIGVLPPGTQLTIRTYITDNSTDITKTEADWINNHMGDDLGLLYEAIGETIKRINQ